jgi:hypothetical protein
LQCEEYNKVFCLLNISELYKNKFQSEVFPLSERKYDVVFMGTTQYDEKITKHRLDVIKNIEKVCIKNNMILLDRNMSDSEIICTIQQALSYKNKLKIYSENLKKYISEKYIYKNGLELFESYIKKSITE